MTVGGRGEDKLGMYLNLKLKKIFIYIISQQPKGQL
jgi:hypothetical protein